MDWPGK